MRLVALLLIIAPLAAHADPKFAQKDGHLVLPSPILFEAGGAKLKAESDVAIAHIGAYLAAKTDITLARVESHTDAEGATEHNQKLSEQRALAVARAIVAKGIDCKRLIAVGFGETKPVAPNDTPENKAMNRRTELVNVALRGHNIGGMASDGGGHVAGDACAKD